MKNVEQTDSIEQSNGEIFIQRNEIFWQKKKIDQITRSKYLAMTEAVPVPEDLPKLLKNYTKAVIRTQPDDLLKW